MKTPNFAPVDQEGSAKQEDKISYHYSACSRQTCFLPKAVVLMLVVLLAVYVYGLVNNQQKQASEIVNKNAAIDQEASKKDNFCNVVVVPVEGSLITLSEMNDYGEPDGPQTLSSKVVEYIDKANKNEDVKAVVLWLDSYGGSPVAADEINLAVRRSIKPVVAVVRSAATSAGYLAISSSQRIFTSKYSDVGAIGVTTSYINQSIKDARDGVSYLELVAGQYKGAGNPHRALTYEERKMAQADLDKVYEMFIETVAKDRRLPVETVRKLADGRSYLGVDAVKLKLADEIGDIEWARRYLADKLKITVEQCIAE